MRSQVMGQRRAGGIACALLSKVNSRARPTACTPTVAATRKQAIAIFQTMAADSRRSGRQKIKCHREDKVDHQHRHPYKPSRSPADGNQRRSHRGDEYHEHCARPELQIHRSRAHSITDQNQHRPDEARDLVALAKAITTLRSNRFLRAPENAEAISAAPPTSATMMKPTKAGVIPNAFAASCTDSTKTSLTKATSRVTPARVARAKPMGQGASPGSPCSTLANSSRCVLSENNIPRA